jgi:cell division protein FtsW
MQIIEYFKNHKTDSITNVLTFTLLILGFLIFFSASLGVMARYESKFFGIIQNQFLFGICLGSIAFVVGAYIPKKLVKLLSPFIFLASVLLCILVLIPGIGMAHGGARRWIEIGTFSFQPSETLKYASILFLGWYNSKFLNYLSDFKYRIFPIALLFISTIFVLVEPDLGTTSIILAGIASSFFLTSAKVKDMAILFAVIIIGGITFYFTFPHAKERVDTFLNPNQNTLNQSYQAKQALISLGAGGAFGDGYGKSIQKYHHLPEPVGDSIFAVLGEEFGFVGVLVILILIISLCFRLIIFSGNSRDPFVKSVLVGTPIIILAQTFLNAGSVSGATPFTGVPLPLISHGSTSIIITMCMLGFCSQLVSDKIMHK